MNVLIWQNFGFYRNIGRIFVEGLGGRGGGGGGMASKECLCVVIIYIVRVRRSNSSQYMLYYYLRILLEAWCQSSTCVYLLS